MTTKYGVFSEPEWQAELKGSRKENEEKKQKAADKAGFKSGNLPRSGKLNDATFSAFTSTNICAPYGNSHSPRKGTGKSTGKEGAKAEASSQTPFKPASPMKHSAAPQAGDFYGTLSKTSHTVAPCPPQKKKGDIKPQPRGVYTTVPKTGSYGNNKMTLSEHKGAGGVAGEYQYMADPMAVTASRARGAAGEGKAAAGSPFRPVLAQNKAFAHYEYMANPTEDQNVALSKAAASGAGKKADTFAFKPTRTHGTPLPPVTYMADPLPGPKKHQADKGNAWHPATVSKSDCTRSIVRMNL